jgi:hypothetical protein
MLAATLHPLQNETLCQLSGIKLRSSQLNLLHEPLLCGLPTAIRAAPESSKACHKSRPPVIASLSPIGFQSNQSADGLWVQKRA